MSNIIKFSSGVAYVFALSSLDFDDAQSGFGFGEQRVDARNILEGLSAAPGIILVGGVNVFAIIWSDVTPWPSIYTSTHPQTIYLLTGQIRSGKTTALMELIKSHGREQFCGFLTPDSRHGGGPRIYHDIASGEETRFEVDSPDGAVKVGQFLFDLAAFQRGNEIIAQFVEHQSPNATLIVDEAGKLEWGRREGFWPGIQALMHLTPSQKAIIVTRESLLQQAVREFQEAGQTVKSILPHELAAVLE